MNLLQKLWNWITSLFATTPTPIIEEQECCEEECEPQEECCDHEECEPTLEPVIEIHIKEEPTPVIVEEVLEPEPAEVVEEVVADPAPVGELLRQILLAEDISEGVIRKYQIIETFEGWYDGPIDNASVRASIEHFKSEHGGVINAKLGKIK